jgi:VIT1/CCC1 family predicted Fe2+/Mn2+ transporter
MHTSVGEERTRLLDPVDRVSEILFGLIMAVTILGSLSIATAGKEEMRTVTAAALGCNLAWGLVDAVMYVVRTATGRARNRALAREILRAEGEGAHRLMLRALPDHIAALVGPEESDVMRRRLVGLQLDGRPLLQAKDYVEAIGVFALVVVATFPVALPFLMTTDPATALHASQAIAVVMLFLAGLALGRYAGYARPVLPGLAMAVFGVVLIAAVKALGG